MKKPNQIYVFLLLATSLVVFPDIHRAFSVAQFHFKFPNQGLVFPNMTIDWLKLTIDVSILTIIISIFYGIRWCDYPQSLIKKSENKTSQYKTCPYD